MPSFQRTETINLRATIRDADGDLTDPGTSTKVVVTGPDGTVVVVSTSMAKQSTGVYQHPYTPSATAVFGAYHVRVTAIDNAQTTIEDGEFFLAG